MIVNFFLGILNSPPHDEFLRLVKAAYLYISQTEYKAIYFFSQTQYKQEEACARIILWKIGGYF